MPQPAGHHSSSQLVSANHRSASGVVMVARALLVLSIPLLAACSQPRAKQVPAWSPELSGMSSPFGDPGAVRLAQAKLEAFDYQKADALSVRRHEIRSLANIVTEDVTMVINDPLRQIGTIEQKYLYYYRRGAGPRPTVVMLTLFGEEVVLDKLSARAFCRRGFNVLIVIPTQVLGDTERPFHQVSDILTRNIITARMGVDMLEQFPETDPDRIFAYGTSMGGMRAAILFGVEPRIKKAGVVTGGGDLPGIVSDTEYGALREIREARMAAENIPDLDSLRVYLNEALTVDPLDFACLRAPEDIVFVISSNDQYVKSEFQLKLFNAFSRPREGRLPAAIYTRTGHLITGGRFPEWTSRIAKFFHAP